MKPTPCRASKSHRPANVTREMVYSEVDGVLGAYLGILTGDIWSYIAKGAYFSLGHEVITSKISAFTNLAWQRTAQPFLYLLIRLSLKSVVLAHIQLLSSGWHSGCHTEVDFGDHSSSFNSLTSGVGYSCMSVSDGPMSRIPQNPATNFIPFHSHFLNSSLVSLFLTWLL